MKRAAVFLVLTGCVTVTPMQTASTVDDGAWRVGGQLSAAGYCGSFDGPTPTDCTNYPDGVPLPELRVDARRGLPHRSDVGLSLQVEGQLFAPSRPLQVGLSFEGKRELWSTTGASGRRQLVSISFLAGAAVSGRLGLPPYLQYEWGVSAFYGLKTSRFEAVVGATVSRRTLFNQVGAPSPLPSVDSERIGLTLGLFRRAPAGWAIQLGYLTDPGHFAHGAIQLQYGVFWDLGGRR